MTDRFPINWPNALCAARFVGSLALPPLGWYGLNEAFVALLVLLVLIDWLDGKIAIWFKQQTEIGATLDTVADVTMYACLALGAWWLSPEIVRSQFVFAAMVVGTYATSAGVGLIKFRQWPSYHTRLAKTSWLLIGIGAVLALLEIESWPLSLGLVVVSLTNLESLAITCTLHHPRSDVPSIIHARRIARQQAGRVPLKSD